MRLPAEPNPGDPRLKKDEGLAAAYDVYRDKRAQVEQQRNAILEHLRATAADAVIKLQTEVKRIQTQVQAQKEEVSRQNEQSRQALYQRSTQLSALVYRAPAADAAAASPLLPDARTEPNNDDFGTFKVERRARFARGGFWPGCGRGSSMRQAMPFRPMRGTTRRSRSIVSPFCGMEQDEFGETRGGRGGF